MEKIMITFKMDKDLKECFEQYCDNIGMSLETAFTIFAKKVIREGKIPFELNIDPFYSKENMERLNKSIKDIENGKVKLTYNEIK